MLAPVVENRTVEPGDQLQLDDEVNSEIADRYTTRVQLSSPCSKVAVGDLRPSAVKLVPVPRESVDSAPTLPLLYFHSLIVKLY